MRYYIGTVQNGVKYNNTPLLMFSWRSTPSNVVSLHDQLAANTLAYRQGRPARVESAVREVYSTVKSAVGAYSLVNSPSVFVFNTAHYQSSQYLPRPSSDSVLSNLSADERDEVLAKVRDLFVNNDGLESHVDGTCIKLVWRLPENSTS